MTDAQRAPDPLLVARVLPAGAAIILRDYGLPARRALAAQLKSVCAARGVLLIVGADIDLAAAVGADGVHLPRWRAATAIPDKMIITASCHNAVDLRAARASSAQLAFLSPVFATASHPGATPLGAGAFRRLAAASPLPVIALGGVDETNAAALAGANVAGLAAIGAFLR